MRGLDKIIEKYYQGTNWRLYMALMRILNGKMIKKLIPILTVLLLSVNCASCESPELELPTTEPGNILIEDFETQTYLNWTATGDAFGFPPTPYRVPTEQLNKWENTLFEGKYMITSYIFGDGGQGTLTSPEFQIERNYLNFLVGGGGEGGAYVTLLIDGVEIETLQAAGTHTRKMAWVAWDVSAYANKTARIKIVDNSTIGWGFIDADYFVLSDKPIGFIKKATLTIDKKYLNVPVGYEENVFKINILVNSRLDYEFDVRLSSNPNYWTYINCEKYRGQTIELELVNDPRNLPAAAAADAADALQMIYQSDEPQEKTSFYTERLRPRFHYTVARAWLTDVCGIFYYNGKWHLQYQRNPFGIEWQI
jgi:fructan beta-fructosidase